MNIRKSALIFFSVLYAVLWIGGIASYAFGLSGDLSRNVAASLFLWCAAAISFFGVSSTAMGVRLIAVSVAALLFEIAGVSTGIVFGSYRYESGFGFAFFGVPLVISAAWLILLSYVRHIVIHTTARTSAAILLAAAWMVTIDLVIDPVSVGPVGFWTWTSGGFYYGVPFWNFFGWFAVSLLLFPFLMNDRTPNDNAHIAGFSVLLFFMLLAVLSSLLLPAIIGGILLAGDIVLRRQDWSRYAKMVNTMVRRETGASDTPEHPEQSMK